MKLCDEGATRLLARFRVHPAALSHPDKVRSRELLLIQLRPAQLFADDEDDEADDESTEDLEAEDLEADDLEAEEVEA